MRRKSGEIEAFGAVFGPFSARFGPRSAFGASIWEVYGVQKVCEGQGWSWKVSSGEYDVMMEVPMSKLQGRADFGVTITSAVQAAGETYRFRLKNGSRRCKSPRFRPT